MVLTQTTNIVSAGLSPNSLGMDKFPLLMFGVAILKTIGGFYGDHAYKTLPEPIDGGFVYGSYQNHTVCYSAHRFETPSSLLEIQQIINAARALNVTVKPLGNRHSDNDVICTDGVPVYMGKINFIQVNDNSTVTVGAGAELTDILEELHKHGQSLSNVPIYGGATMGGLLGCASHGSSLIHSGITDQLVGLTFVDGTGAVNKINDPEGLRPFKANFGLLGIIYSATIKTVPLYKIRIHNYPVAESQLSNGDILKMARNHDMFQFWWFPSVHSVVISKGDFISTTTPGNSTTSFIPELDKNTISATRSILEVQQELKSTNLFKMIQEPAKVSLYGYSPQRPLIFTEDGVTLTNPAIGYGHRLLQNRCRGSRCPWDLYPIVSGLGFEVEELPKVVDVINTILNESSAAEMPVHGFYFRFSPASEGLMAVENGRDTLHVEWVEFSRIDSFSKPRVGLGTNSALMQALIKQLDGRPHWGQNGLVWFTGKFLQRRKTNLFEFRAYMKRYDPHSIFLNNFGRRILELSDFITLDPREKYCALNEKCICQYDKDCGSKDDMKCGLIYGYKTCRRMESTDVQSDVNNDIMSKI